MLSHEQLEEIYHFLADPMTLASLHWFDVSAFGNWDDYNFNQPAGRNIIGVLARRDLFLTPARQLNNRALTNMSPEALAALAFAQTYVEETWDQTPPWEGDSSNPYFNWVHVDLLTPPQLERFLSDDYLYQERVRYWYAVHQPMLTCQLTRIGRANGSLMEAILRDINPPRLAGYSFPIANQLILQTVESAFWYADYVVHAESRYGVVAQNERDSISSGYAETLYGSTDNLDELIEAVFASPYTDAIIAELAHPQTASFWNVMRFLHAGARHREGGASPDFPQNGQPPLFALRYESRTPEPVGRPQEDISTFALLTTVYSDSLLLDFTNWDFDTGNLLVNPVDELRPDGIHRLVSERNKAIFVIEHMGNEMLYPNATHVSGSRGLGLSLTLQYNDLDGDFLPYIPDEAFALVMALYTEATGHNIEASRVTLCYSPLLRQGYEQVDLDTRQAASWDELTDAVC